MYRRPPPPPPLLIPIPQLADPVPKPEEFDPETFQIGDASAASVSGAAEVSAIAMAAQAVASGAPRGRLEPILQGAAPTSSGLAIVRPLAPNGVVFIDDDLDVAGSVGALDILISEFAVPKCYVSQPELIDSFASNLISC